MFLGRRGIPDRDRLWFFQLAARATDTFLKMRNVARLDGSVVRVDSPLPEPQQAAACLGGAPAEPQAASGEPDSSRGPAGPAGGPAVPQAGPPVAAELPADGEILADTEVLADTGQSADTESPADIQPRADTEAAASGAGHPADAAVLHPDFGQQQRSKAARLARLLATNATRFADEVTAIHITLSPDAADAQATTARRLAEAMTGQASEMVGLRAEHQFPLGLKMSYARARGEVNDALQVAQQIMSSLGTSTSYAEDLDALVTAASQLTAAVADLREVLGPYP